MGEEIIKNRRISSQIIAAIITALAIIIADLIPYLIGAYVNKDQKIPATFVQNITTGMQKILGKDDPPSPVATAPPPPSVSDSRVFDYSAPKIIRENNGEL